MRSCFVGQYREYIYRITFIRHPPNFLDPAPSFGAKGPCKYWANCLFGLLTTRTLFTRLITRNLKHLSKPYRYIKSVNLMNIEQGIRSYRGSNFAKFGIFCCF